MVGARLCGRPDLPALLPGHRLWRHHAGRDRQSQGRHRPRDDGALRLQCRRRPRLAGDGGASRSPTQIGPVETVNYTARNPSDKTDHRARPIFNVTPERAGIYFNKIECFCFTEQTLKPGETVQMPVTFFVDPDIDKNAELKTIHDITLSYTFYASNDKGS